MVTARMVHRLRAPRVPVVSPAVTCLSKNASHRTLQLVHEQSVDEAVVGELGVGESKPHAQDSIVAQLPYPGEVRFGGDDRIPGAGSTVGFQVLHRVQQVGDPAEQPSCFTQRSLIAGPPGQVRGGGEHVPGRLLGGCGHLQKVASRPDRKSVV